MCACACVVVVVIIIIGIIISINWRSNIHSVEDDIIDDVIDASALPLLTCCPFELTIGRLSSSRDLRR